MQYERGFVCEILCYLDGIARMFPEILWKERVCGVVVWWFKEGSDMLRRAGRGNCDSQLTFMERRVKER